MEDTSIEGSLAFAENIVRNSELHAGLFHSLCSAINKLNSLTCCKTRQKFVVQTIFTETCFYELNFVLTSNVNLKLKVLNGDTVINIIV